MFARLMDLSLAHMLTGFDLQGKWKPRKIPNPDYFEDNDPYRMSPIVSTRQELLPSVDQLYCQPFMQLCTSSD